MEEEKPIDFLGPLKESSEKNEVKKIKVSEVISVGCNSGMKIGEILNQYPGYVEHDPDRHDTSQATRKNEQVVEGIPNWTYGIVKEIEEK